MTSSKRKTIATACTLAVLMLIALSQQLRSHLQTSPHETASRRLKWKKQTQNEINQPSVAENAVLLHGIFTTRSESEAKRREIMRDTYLKDPRFCPLKDLTNPSASTPSTCFVYYTFVIGGGDEKTPKQHQGDYPLTLAPSTEEEINMGDIVVLNVKENMNDGKSQSWFKYAASLVADGHKIDYIAKVDSDTLPNTDAYVDFIKDTLHPAPYNKRVYGGRSWVNYRHNGLFHIGGFYFMSTDLAHYISNLTPERQKEIFKGQASPEDLRIGVLVFSSLMPVNYVDLRGMIFWAHPVKQEEKWRNLYNGGMQGVPYFKVKEETKVFRPQILGLKGLCGRLKYW